LSLDVPPFVMFRPGDDWQDSGADDDDGGGSPVVKTER